MLNVLNKTRSLLSAFEAYMTVALSSLKTAYTPLSEEEKLDRDLKRVQRRAARIQDRNNAAAEAHERTIDALQSSILQLDDGFTRAEIVEQGISRLLGEE